MTEPATLRVGGTTVARYDDGDGLDPQLVPRPHLHPVRTLDGITVTDACPADHRWHLGVSVAIQDVDRTNFWGGRTYVRDRGYQWLDDHGRVVRGAWLERTPDRLEERLDWVGRDGSVLLAEHRVLRASAAPVPGAWRLDLAFTLRNVTGRPIELGSPATNGRDRAGYGGLFWRLPAHDGSLGVFTADASGEEAVHGTVSGWIAATAADPDGREWSVVIEHGDGPSARDPWFVRVAGYPGIGASLAWATPVSLGPGGELRRAFGAVIVNARAVDTSQVELWLRRARL
ncbi:PmoA family protein [Actinoallomurus sp. NBC_01490]|uniref:DUF6807 domain-containing protein n=1 Tax=Actinoallomurus sp. NBC_01490 TaxID=2903557 RepID=UPI002E370DEE|nr:PmoA family protein [Actinoallomurus sp. NBC_01490]